MTLAVKRHRRSVGALAFAVAAFVAVAGCGSSGTTSESSAAPQTNSSAPASEAPSSEAPGSEAPDSEAPGSEAPDSEAPGSEAPDSEAPAAAWPRTFENADGTTTEIPAKPERIVSTTVTSTGTLLAIDAPVVASGSAANGQFFAQWADEAESRGVTNIFPAGSVKLEAVLAEDPDLIIVSTGGADSLLENVADLQVIAPTIVIDYGAVTWQELALQFGDATGLEEQAAATVADFDTYVEEAAAKIAVPEGTANLFSFNGPGEYNNIARKNSVHGDLLESLGFTLEDPPLDWHTIEEPRADFVFAAYENLTELTSETSFVLAKDDEAAQAFATDPTMANVPSVAAGQVYGLGKNSFRIDLFSATEIVDHIVDTFGTN